MKRRKLVLLALASLLGAPALVRAQQAGKTYRVALLTVGTDPKNTSRMDPFFEAMRELNYAPGLFAELYQGAEIGAAPVKVRVDPQVNFDWQDQSPDEALPKDNFAIRWSGVLKPPAAGRYDLIVIANMGVRVRIGGQLICDEADLSRKRNGARVSVEMPPALHPIVVEYWDKTGKAEVQLKWQRPGAQIDEAIPPSAFFHDLNLERAAIEGQ